MAYQMYFDWSSTRWPTTPAVITKSEIKTVQHEDNQGLPEDWYFPDLEYRFEISGNSYTGSRLRFDGTPGSRDPRPSQDIQAKYPVGQEFPLYYNPAQPSLNVILPGTTPFPLHLLLATIFMGGVCWIVRGEITWAYQRAGINGGKPLTQEQIRAHLKAQNPDGPTAISSSH